MYTIPKIEAKVAKKKKKKVVKKQANYEIQIFDDPTPMPIYQPPKPYIIPLPMVIPKKMPIVYEMNAPKIPPANRKMIYKE